MTACWRLLTDGAQPPVRNMAVDEALFLLAEGSPWDATLRFYSWTPPTLSLGYAQDIGISCDLRVCETLGIAVVRRPTGGWAVLHDDELTYSVTASVTKRSFLNCDLTASYRKIAEAFQRGLSRLAIPCQIVEQTEGTPMKGASAVPCFQVPSRHEITSPDGRKIIGSAQRRGRNGFLQHGSVPITLDRRKLYAVTGQNPPAEERFASLSEIGPRRPSPDELADALREGFQEYFKAEIKDAYLTDEEEALVHRLEREKYSSAEWNVGRRESPALKAEAC
jgi:lipoate-protein ligase A